MSKILCHQYATGRGTTGYGFVAFSREKDSDQPSYSFSPGKSMGLRFSQMPEGIDCVMEIDPASTDYRHIGAFMSKKREEAGSVSIYTHVLITAADEPELPEVLGLLKEGNFLTPDEFSQITYNQKVLQMEEKEASLADDINIDLNNDQRRTLGEFLAKYWRLLEQREWARNNDKAEIAILIPGKDTQERVARFAEEVIRRLPEYVRPAVSVSFGAQWSNRGSVPCVCCVLPDENENPFPCYNLIKGESNNRKASSIEKEIGERLLQGNEEAYPETYRRIAVLAKKDDRFRNMSRGFTTMAYCVSEVLPAAETDDPIQKKKEIYLKLLELADKRYGIRKDEIQFVLLPMLCRIFELINNHKSARYEEKEWIVREGVSLHLLDLSEAEKQELTKADQEVIGAYYSMSIEQMTGLMNSLRDDLEKKNKKPEQCFEYLEILEKALLEKISDQKSHASVRTGLNQCNRLVRDVPEQAKELIEGYKGWLRKPDNRRELLSILSESTTADAVEETLLFELLETKDNAESEEEENLTLYLSAVKTAGKKNNEEADKILSEAYQSIIKKAAKYEKITDTDFRTISEYALSREQTLDTVEPVVEFAIRNCQKQGAVSYLEKIKMKMAESEEADSKEFRDQLLIELDKTFKPFNKNPDQEDEAIRILLEKNGNQIPDNLANIVRFRRRRLVEGLKEFIGTSSLDEQSVLQQKWDENEKDRFDCSWNDLTKEDMKEPLEMRLKTLFNNSDNRIGFLGEIRERITDGAGDAYNDTLKAAWTGLMGDNYDTLWKKAGAEQEGKDLRETLDSLVDKSGDVKLIEQCGKSTAGKARVFIQKLNRCLGENHDLGRQPEETGKLIRKLRDEKDFPEYILLDEAIGKEKINDQNTLAQALLKQLSMPQSRDGAYWLNVLDSMQEGWKNKNDPMRKLNLFSFIAQALERMKIGDLGKDLKMALGDNELASLWNEKIDKSLYRGNGKKILNESLTNWLQNM